MEFNNGLKRTTVNHSVFYYSDDMLEHNIAITENTVVYDNFDRGETIIKIIHYNDLEAIEYHMYWGNVLAPIQSYRIVKDIYELYVNHPLSQFFEIAEELCIDGTTTTMKVKPKQRKDFKIKITSLIEQLYRLEKLPSKF